MKYLFIILLLISQFAIGGTRYTLSSTSGGINASQTTEGHALVAGDSIFLNSAGTYSYLQVQGLNATNSAHIVIVGNGATITGTSFAQVSWYDCSYIDFVNVIWTNWYGQHLMNYGIHDLLFTGCNVTWDASSNRNNGQSWMQWDYVYSPVSMVFDGTKAKTFYNIRFTNATWSGITNTYFMQLGTGWGGSDDNRSICTDFRFDHLNFVDFRNTAASGGIDGNTVGGVFGTVFNFKADHNSIDRMAGSAAFQRAHIAVFTIYGNGECNNNRMDSSYAQMLRAVPLYWTGLTGYGKGFYIWNNIDHNAYDYSAFEFSQNNKGDRNSTYLIYPANDTCVHNTLYRTRASSYLAGSAGATYRYHAVVVDDVNQGPQINFAAYNVIAEPEFDFTYNSGNDYITATISSANANLVKTSNQQYQHWTTSLWDDTLAFIPATTSPLINAGAVYSFRTTDFYDNTLTGTPDAGAVERIAAGTPPSCTTNNATTSIAYNGGTLNWNAATGATSYAVYLFVNGGTAPATRSYTAAGLSQQVSGLSPATVYKYYVVPENSYGAATGCGTAFTIFTTGARYFNLNVKRK